jgi:hypothetical protein
MLVLFAGYGMWHFLENSSEVQAQVCDTSGTASFYSALGSILYHSTISTI